MARKLFISFLGTNVYKECIYHDNKMDYTPTPFIQTATLEQIGVSDWTETDAVCIFVTDNAKKQNWDKSISERKESNNQTIPYHGLEKELNDMQLKANFESVPIVDGKDEDEIWQIFQTVFNKIQDEDEIYIDLTHAFRYLPMLVLVLSNYSKFLKHTTIKHLSYGNWEARDKETNRAPIIDLLPLTMLQDWTNAAADFLNNGYAENLERLAKSFSDVTKEGINDFIDILKQFTIHRQTCRGAKITEENLPQEIHDIIQQINSTEIPPLSPLLFKIREKIIPPLGFIEKVVDAANWCLQHHLWQQCLSILQEGIITFFCHRHNLDFMKRIDREIINQAFTISLHKWNQKRKDRVNWKVKPKSLPKTLEMLHDDLISNRDVCKAFGDITKLRNNYMHAGYNKEHTEEITPEMIEETINNFKTKMLPKIDPKYKPQEWRFTKKVFLNLSNHPVEMWDKTQRNAAKEYGDIEEKPFPNIPANTKIEDITKLAKKTAQEIFEVYNDEIDLTIHVMGELTFTYQIVSLLKGCGIRCVASCSERNVKELDNGERISLFKFSQFREY